MLCNQYHSASSYVQIELSIYLNVRHVVFILCVIWPGKLALSAKSVLLMNVWQLHSFSTDKIMVRSAFSEGGFLDVNHTQLCETAYWPLLYLVVWYGALWLLLYLITSRQKNRFSITLVGQSIVLWKLSLHRKCSVIQVDMLCSYSSKFCSLETRNWFHDLTS